MAFWKQKHTIPPEKPQFPGPNRSGPEEFVLSFCVDFKLWNDYSIQCAEASSEVESNVRMQDASYLYSHFLKPFLADNVHLQPISFGTSATFAADRASINSVNQQDRGFEVNFSVRHEHLDFSDYYIAEIFVDEDENLRLRQIYYVDPFPDGKDPNLPIL